MPSCSNLKVEPAQPADAEAVEALLDAAAVWQQSRGFDQWRPGQFGEEVRQTIAGGYLFVARREGAIVGCFMFDTQQPAWMGRWLVEQGRVAHGAHVARLAVSRELSGERLGVELLTAACELAAERGLAYLRLDCPSENLRLRRYYLDAGFVHYGDVSTPGPNGERWVSSVFERSTALGAP